MPFYAIVAAASGDILDVVESLDAPPPPGAIAIELPARDDDVRSWLARWRKDRGGGSGGEILVEREEAHDGGRAGRHEQSGDAEQFFARLAQEIARAETSGHQFTVLLFDLAPQDREDAPSFVHEALAAAGIELLACDLVARLRAHLVAVVMPDADPPERPLAPARGAAHSLAWPRDREAIEQLLARRHPLLRRSLYRSDAAGRGAA